MDVLIDILHLVADFAVPAFICWLLDQYAADKGKLPQSLDDLVTEHYLRAKPKDPITDNNDWDEITGEDPYSKEGNSGVIDVHSKSGDTSTEGTPYSEW